MHLRCFFDGHDDHFRHGEHRVYLECQRCGRESVGWRDDELPRPKVLYSRPVKRKFKLLKAKRTA